MPFTNILYNSGYKLKNKPLKADFHETFIEIYQQIKKQLFMVSLLNLVHKLKAVVSGLLTNFIANKITTKYSILRSYYKKLHKTF